MRNKKAGLKPQHPISHSGHAGLLLQKLVSRSLWAPWDHQGIPVWIDLPLQDLRHTGQAQHLILQQEVYTSTPSPRV